MKAKLIAVAALLLLFIPTYCAVAYYISAQNAPVDVKVVSKMVMTDTAGASYAFEKSQAQTGDNISDNMIAFFMDMNGAAKAETSLPDPLVGTDYFKVTYQTYDKESVYHYYFTTDPTEAYYVDGEGAAYRISQEYAEKFILSEYAKCLYPAAELPALTVFGEPIQPTTMVWQYLNALGNYNKAADINNSGAVVPTYKVVGGNFNLAFNIEPDYLTVKIVENGEEIFNDLYENIGQVNLNENTTINITLVAKWYDSAERPSNGEAIYSFYADVQAQPVFYLGESSIEPGEFVVLTGINIDSPDAVTFTSEPSIDYTPVFFKDGKYVRALIPISIYLPEVLALPNTKDSKATINYNFTVSASGISQTITLTVKDKQFKPQTIDISTDIENVKRSASVLEAFSKAMSTIYTSRESTVHWDGAFIEPVRDNLIRTGYGIYRTIKNSGTKYRHEGIDYIVNSTDKALAANGGKVIYVGEQVVSGKIVVVDHGLGLKSTYCHLSAVNVSEGAIVKKGDILGTVGATGFTDGLNLHYTLSVFNVTVCPYSLWDEGVVMTKLD